MKKLENIIELLRNIKTDGNGYVLGDHMEYEISWTKDLPPRISRITKTTGLWGSEYKVYFKNNVNRKRLERVCKDKKYWNYQTTHRLSIGYNEEIVAEEDFISFNLEKKTKALEIIKAYLKK